MFPRMPMINGLMGPNQQRFPTNQGAGPCMPDNFPPLNRMPFTDNPRYRPVPSNVNVSSSIFMHEMELSYLLL